MSQFTVLKCPSCGSSVIEAEDEKLAECSHCGSKLLLKGESLSNFNAKYPKLIVSLLILIIVGGALGFYISQQSSNSPRIENKIETKIETKIEAQKIEIPKIGIPNVKFNMLKMNSKAMTITPEDLTKDATPIEPKVSIVHQVKGETIIGGLYWIVTIRNDSDQIVLRPRVIASLFDENNKRIDEQNGWSKLIQLQPGQQTSVLVLISKPPIIKFSSKLQGKAKFVNVLPTKQAMLEVLDFTLIPKGKGTRNVDMVGDVKNNNEYQVDFVRVIAFAKDDKGNTIGIADAYVSNSSLAKNDQSGFKIKAGTFVTEPPASWSLWAFGSKHRKKL